MSVKTFFERLGEDIEAVFKKVFSATWEQKAIAAIGYTEPFITGILAIVDPAIAPLVAGVMSIVTQDLTTVKTTVQQGTVAPGSSAASTIVAALNSVKAN